MAPVVTDNSSRLEHMSIKLVINRLSDHDGKPLVTKKTLFPICIIVTYVTSEVSSSISENHL